jgi:alkylated DNA repair dioxygenase AlkB
MDAPVTYIPGFAEHPDAWFTRLWGELDWEQRPDAPRREYWTNTLGRSYTYGRGAGERTYHPRPSHVLIDVARDRLKAGGHGFFSGCFLNGYEGKRDWLGWHEDDDPGIDHSLPIAILTVGQGRNIQFRKVLRKSTGKGDKGEFGPVETLMLESGSLALMRAGMQDTHQHRIPKADFEAKPRISLTFRGLL